MNKHWKPLQPQDIVDIVAPASACSAGELRDAQAFVESLGLIPRIPKGILNRQNPILSNTDPNRFRFLKQALLSTTSKAVWCVRGGYGSGRLIPFLQTLTQKKTKLFIGLSDVTAIHLFLNQDWHWPTLHAPMLGTLKNRSLKEQKEIVDVIFGRKTEVVFSGLRPLNAEAIKRKTLRSQVIGGNLMTLQSSLGTSWNMDGKNKIVFLEEVNERAYRLDRMLIHLIQGGVFEGARAVILGDMIDASEPDGKRPWRTVKRDFAQSLRIPVFEGLKTGHGPLRRTLPFHTPSTLILGREASLTCETGMG